MNSTTFARGEQIDLISYLAGAPSLEWLVVALSALYNYFGQAGTPAGSLAPISRLLIFFCSLSPSLSLGQGEVSLFLGPGVHFAVSFESRFASATVLRRR